MEPELILLTVFFIIVSIVGIGAIVLLSIAPRFLSRQAAIYRIYGKQITANKEPEPYENLDIARREIMRENLTILTLYGIYFLVAVPGIVYYFKGISYGPNVPYTIFLFVIGIPFLACFTQVVWKADVQRLRLIATGAQDNTPGSLVRMWILLIPVMYVAEVQFLYKIANKLFRQ